MASAPINPFYQVENRPAAPSLFKPARVCCCCSAESLAGRPGRGQPNIVTLIPLVYRKGSGKGRQAYSRAVWICERCLSKALTSGRLGWIGGEARALWSAIQASLLDRYSAMVHEDGKSA